MDIDWKCCFNDISKRNILEEVLPQDYKYQVIKYNVLRKSKFFNESKFEASILVNISDEQNVLNFLEEFQLITNTTYNIGTNSDSKNTKLVVFSGARKCHHNIQKRGDVKDLSQGKNTKCQSKCKFKLSRNAVKTNAYPLEFHIEYSHNHCIESATAMKFLKVNDKTKEKYNELFKQGLTPS